MQLIICRVMVMVVVWWHGFADDVAKRIKSLLFRSESKQDNWLSYKIMVSLTENSNCSSQLTSLETRLIKYLIQENKILWLPFEFYYCVFVVIILFYNVHRYPTCLHSVLTSWPGIIIWFSFRRLSLISGSNYLIVL